MKTYICSRIPLITAASLINMVSVFAAISLLSACGGGGGAGKPPTPPASSSVQSSAAVSSVSSDAASASSTSVDAPSSVGISSSSVMSSAVASSSSSSVVDGAAVVYQAEDNFFSGGVTAANTYVTHFSAQGARVIFTVNTPATANYATTLVYANSAASNKTLSVYVNGLFVRKLNLAGTGADTAWANQIEQLTLRTGVNTISYQYDSGDSGGVNLDSLSIAGALPLAERGATVSFQQLEAENGVTNGQVSNSGTTYLTVAAEASGRKYVTLDTGGHYVEWIAPKQANTLVMRYGIPDSANGGGTNATLNLYINDIKVKALDLSSRYAWVYGNYPFNDKPSNGMAHRFFDDIQIKGLDIPAGAKIKLQKDADNTAAYYRIDLIDFEQIESAYVMPENFISIIDFGAIANDTIEDTSAFTAAMVAAKNQGKGLWFPEGTFILGNFNLIELGNIHIRGAGMWHTVLQTLSGKGGMTGKGGGNVTIADLQIRGERTFRNDSEDAALGGDFGKNSLVQNVWIEHMKVGFWLAGSDGLYIVNGRIRNTWADGINFAGGVKNTVASHISLRNTGDDALAMWSVNAVNANNAYRYNTVSNPILANCFAIYGGQDNKILDNIASDTLYAPAGIAISNRFEPTPFMGVTEVRRNTINRAGGWEPTYNYNVGAVWVFADKTPINATILIDTLDINDSPFDGIFVSNNRAITDLRVSNVRIKGAGRNGLYFNVIGAGSFNNVTVEGATLGGLNNVNPGFVITRGEGNSGW
ncbi:hypothetical protein [Cellvibrio sp.]